MKKNHNVSLKTFTETCNNILEKCSIDELKEIILGMADKVDIEKRQAFIDSLLKRTTPEPKPATIKANILDKIENLKSEILDAANEEPDWDNYYNDEDSSYVYEKFLEPLIKIFDEVEALFDYDNYDIAKKAYEKLLFILRMEDDYGRGISIHNLSTVDPGKVRGKYFCSIYLTEPADQRVASLVEAMNKYAYFDPAARPKLADIINAVPNPLPELQLFLTNLNKVVSKENTPCYRAWLREAIFLRDGSAGLEKLALSSGNTNPRVYLDWIQSLIDGCEYLKALQAINLALGNPSMKQPIKAAIADLMLLCGQKIGDSSVCGTGLWISFENKPSLDKLIALYEQVEPPKRKTIFFKAAQCIEKHLNQQDESDYEKPWENDDVERPAILNTSLLLHGFLLAQEENLAWQIAKTGAPLGWSSSDNPQPLFVSYYLIRSLKKPWDKLPNYLNQLWLESLQSSTGRWSLQADNGMLKKLEGVYQEVFKTEISIENEIVNWCLAVSENRVCDIVSNLHRGAYDRAALVVGACTEVLKTIAPENSMDLFNKIKLKFSRHYAFQKELKKLNF